MIYRITISIKNQTALVKINIHHLGAEAKKRILDNCTPIAPDAEVSKFGTISFLKVDSLTFFEINCHNSLYLV